MSTDTGLQVNLLQNIPLVSPISFCSGSLFEMIFALGGACPGDINISILTTLDYRAHVHRKGVEHVLYVVLNIFSRDEYLAKSKS